MHHGMVPAYPVTNVIDPSLATPAFSAPLQGAK
jgi:hypothetical protein